MFVLILSRVFTIVVDGKKTKGMIPVVDMPNHSYQNNLKWHFSEDEGGFIFEAQDEISRGQEISINYGLQSNDLFFLRYGFINADNAQHNEVPMFVYLNKEDAGFEQKLGMLSISDPFRRFYIRNDLNSLVMSEFVAWIRFVVFDVENEDQDMSGFMEYVN